MNRMRDAGLRVIAVDPESEEAWREKVFTLAHRSLLPGTKSVRILLFPSPLFCYSSLRPVPSIFRLTPIR